MVLDDGGELLRVGWNSEVGERFDAAVSGAMDPHDAGHDPLFDGDISLPVKSVYSVVHVGWANITESEGRSL